VHAVPAREQLVGEVRADEARPACDQKAHLVRFIAVTPEGMPDLLSLRRATEADAELLLEWRNDPDTRAGSFQQDPIGLEEHRAWLRGVLADSERVLLVVELDGVPSGSVRVDREDAETAEIHIALAASARGRKVGLWALREASQQADGLLGVKRIRARVKSDNLASLRAFEAAGFERVDERDGVVELSRAAST
jgi:RimJ/RimL family protein N-acetyltransferase